MSYHYCAKCNGLASFVDAAQLAEHEAREHGCARCFELESRLEHSETERRYQQTEHMKARAEVETLESRLEEVTKKYDELIYQVGNKFPDESRHETAKRYLAAFEALGSSNQASAVEIPTPDRGQPVGHCAKCGGYVNLPHECE